MPYQFIKSEHVLLLQCSFVLLAVLSEAACFVEEDVTKLKETTAILARQIMMQQMFVQERLRITGSGFRQVRMNQGGTQPYMSDSVSSSNAYLAIHAHKNHIRTVGMGEVQVVMNGVEFRTHHNDYMIQQPSTTSANFLEIEDIPFPDVPPEVTSKSTVEEQIDEMCHWFQAFKDQDHSVRDYRKYFKPVICYLEAFWIHPTSSVDADDPFRSDRHANQANDWMELHDKVKFNSYSGLKGRSEDLAYLPTTVIEMVNETEPVLAQWTYRPLCHPIKDDIPTSRFRLVDDVTARMKKGLTKEKYANTRFAHFELNSKDSGINIDRELNYELLDDIMSQVPGLNNHGAFLENDLFGYNKAYMINETDYKDLNAAYYHRWYKHEKLDAMGEKVRHTGFNDPNIFMAMTDQEKVAGMSVGHRCDRDRYGTRGCKVQEHQKWSYALPLEIIYLTPISKWNPHDIVYHGNGRNEEGQVVSYESCIVNVLNRNTHSCNIKQANVRTHISIYS